MSGALAIGVLADSAGKLPYLCQGITEAGHRVAVSSSCLAQVPVDLVDAWVIDADLEQSDAQTLALEDWLAHAPIPVIVADSSEFRPGSTEHSAWLRRTVDRLRRLGGDINLTGTRRARQVWVLAASTGGPAAVKAFIARVPAGLDLAFIYVQHIDNHQTGVLVRMLAGSSTYSVAMARQGMVLSPDTLVLVPADQAVELLENGTLLLGGSPWQGAYAPSIDQMAANVARVCGASAGLIVFTGMGDDGAAASRLIKQRGGQVWVQRPDTCVSPSMPDSALATGCVDCSEDPEALADALVQRWQFSAGTPFETRGQTHT